MTFRSLVAPLGDVPLVKTGARQNVGPTKIPHTYYVTRVNWWVIRKDLHAIIWAESMFYKSNTGMAMNVIFMKCLTKSVLIFILICKLKKAGADMS